MSSVSGDANAVIGHVTEASGPVIVVNQDGEQRILEAGDAVYLNEQVITQAGASASIRLTDNRIISISGQSSFVFDDSFQNLLSIYQEDSPIELLDIPGEPKTINEIVQPDNPVDVSPASPEVETARKAQPEKSRESDSATDGVSHSISMDMPLIEREIQDEPPEEEAVSEPARLIMPQVEYGQIFAPVDVNYIPVALSASHSGSEDSPVLEGQLQAKDANTGETLSFYLLSKPEKGSITLSESGAFRFEPGMDFQSLGQGEQERVSFSFEVRDPRGNISQASVDINITGVNDAPDVERAITESTGQNHSPLTINLLEHAADIDSGDSLSVTGMRLQSGDESGVSISLSGNELIIDPQAYKYLAEGEQEVLSYEYRITDIHGAYVMQTVEIIISGQNDIPVVSSAAVHRSDQNEESLTVNLLDGASDVDLSNTLNVVSLQLEAGDPKGIFYDAQTNSLELDASAYAELVEGETETIEYSYQVDDGEGGQVAQTATIEVEGVNDAPTSQSSQAVIDEDSPYIFAVADFAFTDIDSGSSLQTVRILSLPASGRLLYNGTAVALDQDISRADLIAGRLKFEPAADENGTDYADFQFKVGDGELFSGSHSFRFDVTPVNDAPDISQAMTSAIIEDAAVETINLLQHANDVDGDALSIIGLVLESGNDVGVTVSGSQLSIDPDHYDYLPDSQTETLIYRYRITDGNGSETEQTATITITGTNDGAVILSPATINTVVEDTAPVLAVSGDLNVMDTDSGEAAFTAETISGSYGQLTINSAGNWSYQADNTRSEIQSLGNGDTATESFSVRTLDGTTHNITISLSGVNDRAQITGTASANITEDIAVSVGDQLLASGQLQVTDIDSGEALFNPGTVSGSYGSLNIDSGGNWLYTADNSQTDFQSLGQDDQLVDILTVTTLDGTSQNISITINGTNDTALITGVNAGNVTEDAAAQLTTSGQLNITDTDTGEDEFNTESQTGVYGDISIDADGNWTYSADNSQAAIQELDDGEILTDTFTVSSVDGTSETIDITLHGDNDAPVVVNEINDQAVAEEQSFNFQVPEETFADIDGDNLTYSAILSNGSSLPGWLSFDPATRTFRGTPDDPDIGIIDVRVMANDGTTATAAEFSLEVTPVDDPPELQPASFSIEENSASGSVLGVVATNDVDSPSLTYSLTDDASGRFVINSSTGEITVANSSGLNYEQNTEHTITVQVSDGQHTDTQNYTVSVLNQVEAPVISSGIEEASTDDSGVMSIDLLENAVAVENGETLSVNSLSLIEGDDTGVNFTGTTMTVDASQYVYLPEGVSETIQYTYNVVGSAGASSPQTVTITITGNNEAAEITGVNTATLTEDSANASDKLVATGSLTVSDADLDEEFFVATDLTRQYGTLNLAENGNWSYTADNSQSAIQQLDSGETLEDGFTITSADGTAHQIVITINGTGDAAVINGVDSGSVTEDDFSSYGLLGEQQLIADGTLTISDIDTAAEFVAETITGSYGELTINTNGQWQYIADSRDSDIQELGVTESLNDVITVRAADGTTHDITVTIQGANDQGEGAPVYLGTLAEDNSLIINESSILNAVTDIDGDTLSVAAIQLPGGGHTIVNNNDGTWTLTPAPNFNGLLEMLYVVSDGTAGYEVNNLVRVNVTAVADTAVISGGDSGAVTEDAATTLTASGVLNVVDPDSGEEGFTAETIVGTYGSLVIDADGNWTYTADDSQSSIQSLAMANN